MSMKKENGLLLLLIAAAFLISGYLYFEDKKKKREKVKTLEINIIISSLKNQPNFSTEIKSQIENLIYNFKNIDNKVSNELAQVLQLINIGQFENAIEDLSKIMEYLLSTYYKNNQQYKEWLKGKRPTDLHNLLSFCKEEQIINDIEYQFFIAIKTIRNKEDHCVDLQIDKYLNVAGLITGIGGVMKIATIVYKKKQLSND